MDQGNGRYAAFLSYSHKDAAAARWLHRRLETYRIPRRLVGSEGEHGPVPGRLTPIFRDREDLPAAGDLSERVCAALAQSSHLVVICSPHSAASPWVAKEIETYRRLHPGRPVYAAIVEGDPTQCFPRGLTDEGIEPLAADLRKDRDGRRLGFLKLVAGLSGVGLDALVQRDAARRVRRVTAVTAAALVAVLAMAVMTTLALNARAEAQRQRAGAEGLVEFMLTDLRRELKGAAGLKVLTAANRRALAYYQDQNLAGLPPESLERRARILHAMGEDDLDRNDLDQALRRFEEAAQTTSRLLAADPSNPQTMFAQAQSEFWIGRVAHLRDDYSRARAGYEHYKRLAEQLVAAEPANPKWHGERAYAEGSLCTLDIDSNGDLDAALHSCMLALKEMERAAASRDPEFVQALPNRYAWLADVYRKRGDTATAWRLRVRQQSLLAEKGGADSDDFKVKEAWVTNQFSMAELEAQVGKIAAARVRLKRVQIVIDEMTRADPSNQLWASRRERVHHDLAALTGREEGKARPQR
jgi:tetratricopeptide (TPR) repeat protein